MIFLIDIGNSRTKYVQQSDNKLSKAILLQNREFCNSYFDKHFSQASQLVVANVAKSTLSKELATWCESKNIIFKEVQSEKNKDMLVSAYEKPTTLGVDRWLALLATSRLYPQENVLIIDVGTAITVDLLAANGQHQGGWILAGIKALFNSIISHSTLVHAEPCAVPNLAFGTNTTDNVNNACWAASLGMVEQAIKQAQQLSHINRIIFTGGDGKALMTLLLTQTQENPRVVENIQLVENLIFLGLQEYTRST